MSGGALTANFDVERNWELFSVLVGSVEVTRIFVDTVLKREMCERAEGLGRLEDDAEILRRLRPYTDHSDHLHVRVRCPEGSSRCVSQEERPPGHGCETAGVTAEGEL